MTSRHMKRLVDSKALPSFIDAQQIFFLFPDIKACQALTMMYGHLNL